METVYEPIQRLQLEMGKAGLDALVAMSPENVGYTAGYLIPSQIMPIRHRSFMCVVTQDGKTKMVVAAPEYTYAQEMSRIKEIRPYDLFKDSPMALLAEELKAFDLEHAKVGIETDFVPAELFSDLKSNLPTARFVSAKNTFARARMIKSKAEIESLRRGAQIADKARQIGCKKAKAGMTEFELRRLIADSALKQKADSIGSIQVGSGYRSAFGNPAPSNKKLERGDLVKIDIFLTCDGYITDSGKAAVVAKASEFQTSTWQKLNDVQSALLEKVKPGVSTKELWLTFVSKFKEANLQRSILFLGHGIGLSIHEEPYITAFSDTILEPGMVFCIEPVYKVPGKMGFHIEDELVVTENGYALFTDIEASRKLAVIPGKKGK